MDRSTARDTGGVEDAVETAGHGGQHLVDGRLVGDVGRHEMEVGPHVGR